MKISVMNIKTKHILDRVFVLLLMGGMVSESLGQMLPHDGQHMTARQSEEAQALATEEIYRVIEPMLIQDTPEPEGGGFRENIVGEPGQSRLSSNLYEGMDLVLDERFEEAIPKLEYVIANEPTMIPVWSTLGWTYWRVDRRDDAVKLWQNFLRLDPTHPMAHLLVGNAYVGTGQLKKAEYHLKRSLELNPEQIETRIVLATVYRWTGRYSASIDLLRELRARYPDLINIQNELGISLYENGNYDEALPLLEQGVRAMPDDRRLARLHAQCLLRTGNMAEAQIRARRLLRDDNADLELLLLLADAPRYRGNPEDALPYLEEVAKTAEDETTLIDANQRIVQLRTALWETDPRNYPIDDSLVAAKALLETDPDNPQWQMMYAELLLMSSRYDQAAEYFNKVIEGSSTNVLAARSGLFEVNQAKTRYYEGLKHLRFIESINPDNPYISKMRARLELSRGNVSGAYKAIDELEAAGARGAVAVLVYNGLGESDWSETISARRFRLQMVALKQAGFRFISPSQLEGYFDELPELPDDISEYRPERVVMVTFDRLDERGMRLATKVAEDLDVVFAINIPAVDLTNDRLQRDDYLNKYRETGHWEFGSLLNEAVDLKPVREDGRFGSTLSARIWNEEEEVFESDLEFNKRLRREYAESRRLLREWLGDESDVSFMAYPYSDYGQGLMNNVDDAVEQNLLEAAVNYQMGFINSVFGYAINGDNPLLYQRYVPGAFESGQDVVDHLLSHHPVYMARSMRAEFAALNSELYRAQRNLKLLRRDRYPERPYERVEKFVYDFLALKFGVARAIKPSPKGMFELMLKNPFFGGEFDWFKDSLDRRNWRNSYFAGIYLTPSITAELRAGYGRYKQEFQENLAADDETPILVARNPRVSERFIGAHIGMLHRPENPRRSPIGLSAGLRRHEFRDDADFDLWAWFVQTSFRPIQYFDVLMGVEHDVVASARSLVNEVSQDRYGYAGSLRVRDWWDIWTRVNYYDITDGNERLDANIQSIWEILPTTGVHFGLEYGYIDAEEARDDYWTPYQLRQWFLIGQLRNNFYRFNYDISLKFGQAKEKVRREVLEAYDELVVRAERFQFDPGERPESDWVDVFSASAVLSMAIGEYWSAYWEGFYSDSVDYYEYRSIAGLNLSF